MLELYRVERFHHIQPCLSFIPLAAPATCWISHIHQWACWEQKFGKYIFLSCKYLWTLNVPRLERWNIRCQTSRVLGPWSTAESRGGISQQYWFLQPIQHKIMYFQWYVLSRHSNFRSSQLRSMEIKFPITWSWPNFYFQLLVLFLIVQHMAQIREYWI